MIYQDGDASDLDILSDSKSKETGFDSQARHHIIEGSTDKRLVYTFRIHGKGRESGTRFTVYVHCYETKDGKRSASYRKRHSAFGPVGQFVESTSKWNEEILPWVHGRHIPEVPTYDDIVAIDALKLLEN